MDRAIQNIKNENLAFSDEDDEPLLSLEELSSNYDPHKYSDGTPVPGGERMPRNIRQVLEFLAEHRLKDKNSFDDVANDLVDETILNMRVQGVAIETIARRLGMQRELVQERLSGILTRQQAYMTTSEYRQLQINRIEATINNIWENMEQGDPDAAKNVLLAIERLNKMYQLEVEKSVIEVNIVTDAQSKLIITAVMGVLEKLMSLPEVAALNIEPAVIDGVVEKAMLDASEVIQKAADSPLKIDRKQLTAEQ